MTTTQILAPRYPLTAPREHAREGWAYACLRALVLCLLFSIIFLPEFSRESSAALLPAYSKALADFRFVDLAILFIVFCHAVALGCLRRKRVYFPGPLAAPGLGFLGCIAIAAGYGYRHGGSNFFFDWRGLALGIGLYLVWSFWMQDPLSVGAALRVFLSYLGVRIALLYVLYLAGRSDTLLGVFIPIFDGPVLSCIVFAALLAFCFRDFARDRRSRMLWSAFAVAAYLLVLLCLRRTYWGELGVGTLILLLLKKRDRLRSFILLAIAIAVAAGVLGSSFSGRLRSLDLTGENTQFSADNADHLYDLLDAWNQVRQSPVMGIGLGTSYPTWRIRNWKPESVMVHNAPLHVWLKYGMAGLVCYLWFHLALLRWLYRGAKSAVSPHARFLSVALAYLAAQFVMTLGFAPWPYSELQLTTLMSFILAAAVMGERQPALSPRP